MIINRYLNREILKAFTPILAVLAALFASYNVASFLSDAVNGLLPTDAIAKLVALKVLISLEVLIPISLYLAVVLSFSRLHSDSEFTAVSALRVAPMRVSGAVLTLSAYLALLVAGLSLFARPWAYQKLHTLSMQAETRIDFGAMQAGTFYLGQHGDRVIFLAHHDGPRSPARDVFVRLRHDGRIEIIHARLAQLLPRPGSNGAPQVSLHDAHVYEIGGADGHDDQILSAQTIVMDPDSRSSTMPAYSAVAASSRRLAASNASEDVAELQWRLSTPLSTLLLGMLGIPMSRARPRQGRYTKLGTAILVYFVYYLLFTSARTWVQHGNIAEFPGIWWVPALLSLFLVIALYGPEQDSDFRRGRA